METKLTNHIPCKYVVARYIVNDIRNEPVNVGIIMQSQKDYKPYSKFVESFGRIRDTGEDSKIIGKVLAKIYQEVSESNDPKILNKIYQKYNKGKIQFTEPRGTLVKNPNQELISLFRDYVSLAESKIEKPKKITLRFIRTNVWDWFSTFKKNLVRHNILLHGKTHHFKYDFVVGENKKILHSLTFDTRDALRRTKLFDWNVRDLIDVNGLQFKNFGAIYSEPSETNPQYQKFKQEYKEATKILDSRHYQLIKFDRQNDWKKQLKELAN